MILMMGITVKLLMIIAIVIMIIMIASNDYHNKIFGKKLMAREERSPSKVYRQED